MTITIIWKINETWKCDMAVLYFIFGIKDIRNAKFMIQKVQGAETVPCNKLVYS